MTAKRCKAVSTIQKEIRKLEKIAEDPAVSTRAQSLAYEVYHGLRWAIEKVDWSPSSLLARQVARERQNSSMAIGPVYGVELLDSLPLGGGYRKALPDAADLERVRGISERTVVGYEVLLEHYRMVKAERDILLACRRGEQNCHECPDVKCGDNIEKSLTESRGS